MKKTIQRSDERGRAEHGWLHSRFSFSFADYYNPDQMGFGLLRVLNDDAVEPGEGFGTHPHNNMEIISIVRKGSLAHKDSMGSISTLKPGDVQVMSAGSGIMHSEYNNSQDEVVKFLQIWIHTKERNIKPRYDQKYFEFTKKNNYFEPIVSGEKSDSLLYIHQDAYITVAKLDRGRKEKYELKNSGHGVYIFVLNGSIEIEGDILNERDAAGIYDTDTVEISVLKNTEFILIEVPLN